MVLLESKKVALGTPAYDFSLQGTDDEIHSLSDYSDAKLLVIIFMCNHCPYVQAIWERLVNLQKKFMDQDVQFIGINPNLNPDYPEETLEKMKEYYEWYNMNFPYLQDDTQDVARAYGAECTPDIYVYDQNRKLSYHGRLDDSWQDPENVKQQELSSAIESLLNGQKLKEDNQKPCIGCSIKWRA